MNKFFTSLLVSNFLISSTIYSVPPAPAITSPTTGSTAYTSRPDISGTETQLNTIINVLAGGRFVGTVENTVSNWLVGQAFYNATLTPGQTFSINATATDNTGTSTPSNTVNVTIASVPAITFPADGATVCNPVSLSGNTPLGSSSVEIFDNMISLGNATVTGTTWTFVAPALAPGSHTLTAQFSNPTSPITEFAIGSSPNAITTGPDGNLWVAQAGRIARVTPSGTVTGFALPPGGVSNAIVTGSDGNLWFTDTSNNAIGRITTSGTITEFPVPIANSGLNGIAAGSDGNLWFTQANATQIGRITTAGIITQFPIPGTNSGLSGIAAGPDGNLWFTMTFNAIGRITPTGIVTLFIPTAGAGPAGITAGPDGNLWFTEQTSANIGKITTSGTITEFPLTANVLPTGITAGPDGNLWFTEQNFPGRIGRITPSGTITEFSTPTLNSRPVGITTGPDGKIWFTETSPQQLGRMGTGAQGISDPIIINVLNTSDLSLTKTAQQCSEDKGIFTITVTNNGPSDATNVIVSDLVPTGLKIKQIIAPGWTIIKQGQQITATLPTLVAGATAAPIKIVVNIQCRDGLLINTASVVSDDCDSDLGNNKAFASLQCKTCC